MRVIRPVRPVRAMGAMRVPRPRPLVGRWGRPPRARGFEEAVLRALGVLRGPRGGRLRLRGVLRWAVVALGGVLWWWAALRLVVRPEGAGPWQAAVAAGWSLGLIPLHAVPLRQGAAAPGAAPRWQRGHQ